MKQFYSPDAYTIREPIVLRHTLSVRHMSIRERKTVSLVYILSGRMTYTTASGGFSISDGDAVYLPTGGTYEYTLDTERVDCIQATFYLVRETRGNVMSPVFRVSPYPVYGGGETLRARFFALFDGGAYAVLSALYALLDTVADTTSTSKPYGRLTAAVTRINSRTGETDVTTLAALCGLSPSHFRRLFKARFGMSPVKYKNRLVMEQACRLLDGDELSVAEIADSLGFPDIYTFSQTFRRELGLSPTAYRKKKQNERNT